jgi:hypothetical protein
MKNFSRGVVDIRIGQGGLHPVDAYHQHMGIGRADIVLNEQAAVVLGCRRAEAGMVELQRRRAIDAFHEGLDAPPSLFRKAVHPGAGKRSPPRSRPEAG